MGRILTLIKNKYKNNSKSFNLSAQKTFAILALFLSLFAIPGYTAALSLNDRIKNAEDALSTTKNEKGLLSTEVSRLNSDINRIQKEIYNTNLRINDLSSKINKTQTEILQAEEELSLLKSQLGELIRVMYEEGQASTLEIIVKSSSFNEFVNRSEYLEQVNYKVKEASDRVLELKNTLLAQKSELEKNRLTVTEERNKQVLQKNSVVMTRTAVNDLLIKTQGQESAYKNILTSLYAERAAQARQGGQVIGGGGTGGYPYTGNCGGVDPWSYYTCQCTSYAAWHFNYIQRKTWVNQRSKGWGTGDAWNWVNHAEPQGYTVSSTPRIGAIAVWPYGSLTSPSYNDIYGHVAIVTAISGTTISVSEYNFSTPLRFNTRSNIPINWRNSYTGNSFSLRFIY